MSASQSEHEDPLDPQMILSVLPEREREPFLASYREALSEARDPAGCQYLRRVLRLWRMRADALRRPGFIEAEQAALSGTGRGMLLDDAIRLYRHTA